MMNPIWKKKWLAALRGGEYKQTKGTLREIDLETRLESFCCLGVLCDLVVNSDLPEARALEGHWDDTWRVNFNNKPYAGYLPEPVVKLTGATTHTSQGSLEYLNDSEQKTFAEIADIIEKEF